MTKAVRLLLILGAVASVLWPQTSSAQGTLGGNEPMKLEKRPQFEIAAQAGYSLGALVYTTQGELRLDAGPWFGGAIDFYLKRDIMLELSYFNRSGNLTLRNGGSFQPGFNENLGTQTTQYIQVGSIKTFRKGKIAPFIGGNLGLGWYTSDIPGSSTSTFFAVSGLGGAKIYLADHFGIRLQGRLILPIFFGSLGFYCGTGGCGAGVGGSGTVEGELSGGLFLSF